MEIRFVPFSVEIMTDADWGQTMDSNMDSLQRGAEVCRDSDLSAKREEILEKYVKAKQHNSLLEQTNFECFLSRRHGKKFWPHETHNLRDWKHLAKHGLAEGAYVGSYRDVLELTGRVLERPEMIGGLYAARHQVDKCSPEKRIQMRITGSMGLMRRLRTHRDSSQHSYSQSTKAKSVMEFCLPSEEDFERERPFLQAAADLYEQALNYCENERDGKRLAKKYLVEQVRHDKIMTCTLAGWRYLLGVRRTSPAYKRDMHLFCDLLEQRLNEWEGLA